MSDPGNVIDLEFRRQIQDQLSRASTEVALKDGDGGGTSGGMESRVTRLEEQFRLADERMGRVETKLDTIASGVARLPTRDALFGYSLGVFGVAVAVVAALIGGMGWLETRAARVQLPAAAISASPQPIVIQIPAQQSSPRRKG